jgi:galactokinase
MNQNQSPLFNQVQSEFLKRFGEKPAFIARAPGRVNLIGEHTDYNDGFVMPLAIDRATWIALRPRTDGKVSLYSIEQDDTLEFDLASFKKDAMSWGEYPKGVAWALQDAGFKLNGWEGVSVCDVPMGAGLSSSASFELAVASAFAAVSQFQWDAPKMALLGQKAENKWVGVNCGIMDQMISAVGKTGHAVLIDCRDLSMRAVPLPAGTAVVIMDTSTRRGLVDSAYNERRAQCEAASALFGVKALRDVTLAAFNERASQLDETTRRRARHVISENERTELAADVMAKGDAIELGQLINQSHTSLRDDFEVSNTQLDQIVEIAQATEGCLGARMTGAGFGGCAVALVRSDAAQKFIETVGPAYQQKSGLVPKIYLCVAAPGAEFTPA